MSVTQHVHCSIIVGTEGRAEAQDGQKCGTATVTDRPSKNEAGSVGQRLRALGWSWQIDLLGLLRRRRYHSYSTLNEHVIRCHNTLPPPQLEGAWNCFEFALIKADVEI